MDKKGIELSINVIIIAAIALVVLVILAFLVLKAGSGISKGTTCEQTGGTCVGLTDSCGDFAAKTTTTCSKEAIDANKPICCIPVQK